MKLILAATSRTMKIADILPGSTFFYNAKHWVRVKSGGRFNTCNGAVVLESGQYWPLESFSDILVILTEAEVTIR